MHCSCDLVVLKALCPATFQTVEHTDLSSLSGKTTFLLTVASANWVSELCVARDGHQWDPDGLAITCSTTLFSQKRLSAFQVNQSNQSQGWN